MIRRAPKYENDPDVVTRPDTVPAALRFAEESSPAIDPGPHRELKPYPAVPPPSDEATVVYALSAMQPAPLSAGHLVTMATTLQLTRSAAKAGSRSSIGSTLSTCS